MEEEVGMKGIRGAIEALYRKVFRRGNTRTEARIDPAPQKPDLPRANSGSHLVVLSRGKTPHHAIGIGGGKVVHLGSHPLYGGKESVRCDILQHLALEGAAVQLLERPDEQSSSARIAARAKSLIGTDVSGLPVRDSESFATWCLTGRWVFPVERKPDWLEGVVLSFRGDALPGGTDTVGEET